MGRRVHVWLAAGALLCGTSARAEPPPLGHVTGFGGVFVKSADPARLRAWYRDVLGLPIEAWGGAVLRYDAGQHPPAAAFNVLPATSGYLAPSTRDVMIDFAVDDLDALIRRITAKGVAVLKRDDADASGRFAWILDPDGTKIELWEPKRK